LAKLAEHLATLYSEEDARDVVDKVGLDARYIVFRGHLINIWNSILREAQHHSGKLHAIVEIASARYPDHADRLTNALSLWIEKGPGENAEQSQPTNASENQAIEVVLDVLSTRRAFFKGDQRVLDEATYYAGEAEHLWKMLGYLDAGRAVVVAKSFAEAVRGFHEPLSQIRTIRSGVLKGQLVQLIVACKDYVEQYGRSWKYGFLDLPHIGWGQRLEDFTLEASRYGLGSTDSFEVYVKVLQYLSRSCSDLVTIRSLAQQVISTIAGLDNVYKDRCDQVGTMISEGSEQLRHIKETLDDAAVIVTDIMNSSTDVMTRRNSAKERSLRESTGVSKLLLAIANVRSPKAWTVRIPATTLKSAEFLQYPHVHIEFEDGKNGDIDLTEWFDYVRTYQPSLLTNIDFQSGLVARDSNALVWSRDIYVTGEAARALLDKIG
jgi:hypothetical protein